MTALQILESTADAGPAQEEDRTGEDEGGA